MYCKVTVFCESKSSTGKVEGVVHERLSSWRKKGSNDNQWKEISLLEITYRFILICKNVCSVKKLGLCVLTAILNSHTLVSAQKCFSNVEECCKLLSSLYHISLISLKI